MRREIPLLLTFLFGAVFVALNFFQTDSLRSQTANFLPDQLNDWMSIIIAFTYVLGVGNVLRIHAKKIAGRQEGWGYSVATIAGLAVMVFYGMVFWIPLGIAHDGQA